MSKEMMLSIPLVEGLNWCWPGKNPFVLEATRAQVEELKAACEAALARPEKREWRNGDLVRDGMGQHAIYMQHDFYWLFGGRSELKEPHFSQPCCTYLGNLSDLLAQGPVLVGLTEEEAATYVVCKTSLSGIPLVDAVFCKVGAALAVYRATRGGAEKT